VLVLVLGGCSDTDSGGELPLPAGAPDPAGEPGSSTAGGETAPIERVAALDAVNESGLSGTAMAVQSNGLVVFVVEAAGVPVPGEYPLSLSRGDCAEGGELAATLTPLIGLADHTGESTTTLGTEQVILEGPLSIRIHGTGDVALACGGLLTLPESAPPN